MKYLVLGSAGQIGLSLVKFLREQGHTVSTYDIAADPRQDLRLATNPVLDMLVEECDFVFHLAWDVGGSVYLAKYQDTYDFIANNVKIIANSFDAIRRHNKPFIFASSQMASMSYSSYGLTKSLAEKLVAAMDGVTVKFWNVYGIEHDPEKTHVVTDFINKARHTGVIDMRTDGTESRQMLYADDCSEALYVLSQRYRDLPRDKNYHITNFAWNTMLEVADIIASHFPGTRVQPANKKDTVQLDAKNEPDPYILEYWQPRTSLREGIAQIVSYMTEEK
jgi:nucleoside-diphosphate-sugar epimerase